ncbi:MAG: dTDP-4-dehydrorhamnose 3,5-epimerase [Myxococcota bacterium]
MIFTETEVVGAFIIEMEPHQDERGWFARSFCQDEFAAHGLSPVVAQCNVSTNLTKGTLRGMHSQHAPHEEDKLVRCTRGAIFDVMLDLRAGSPSYRKHVGVELTSANHRSLYIPKGVFHGFLTLEDDSEVFYQMSESYVPGQGRGVRWNDPAFAIEWPGEVEVISERDATYPDYQDAGEGNR